MQASLLVAFLILLSGTAAIKLPSSLTAAIPALAKINSKPEAKAADAAPTTSGISLQVLNSTGSMGPAAEMCKALGGSLPVISTSEELHAVRSAVPAGSIVWIGLKRNAKECSDCKDIEKRQMIPMNMSSELNTLCVLNRVAKEDDEVDLEKTASGFGMKSITSMFSKISTEIQNRIELMRGETTKQIKALTENNEGMKSMLAGQQKMIQDMMAKIGSSEASKTPAVEVLPAASEQPASPALLETVTAETPVAKPE